MPFYEYQCCNCDHQFEVLQKISDEPLVYCPECNESTLKKMVSAVAFRLKGSGWYETDFKNNDKNNKSTKEAIGSSSETATVSPKEAKASDKSAKVDESSGKSTNRINNSTSGTTS